MEVQRGSVYTYAKKNDRVLLWYGAVKLMPDDEECMELKNNCGLGNEANKQITAACSRSP